MCETCETENPWGDLRKMWADADKKAKDWREAGEVKLLEQMNDALNGLKACGWADVVYCPKDGTRFLAIETGSTGVFPCYYQGEWPNGSWWAEAHGDLWPSRPVLWKPMPSNEQYAAQLILDNFDQAVAHAKQDGHKTCAAMVLSRINQIIEGV